MSKTIDWLQKNKDTMYKYKRLLKFIDDIDYRKINDVNYHLK